PEHAHDRALEAAPDKDGITFVAVGKARLRRSRGDLGAEAGPAAGIGRQRLGLGPGAGIVGHSALPPRRMRGSRATSRMSAMMLPTISVAASTSMKVA